LGGRQVVRFPTPTRPLAATKVEVAREAGLPAVVVN